MPSIANIKRVAEREEIAQKTARFEEILKGLATLDEKKRFLWIEIYNNALNEIKLSQKMFDELYESVNSHDSVEQIEAGPVLARYLERANKANDQLIKLAGMLEQAEQADQESDFDDIRAASDAILKKSF